jgi:hypothetical protein
MRKARSNAPSRARALGKAAAKAAGPQARRAKTSKPAHKPGNGGVRARGAAPAASSRRESLLTAVDRAATAARPGQYVYCIIKAEGPRNFGRIGIGIEPTEVHTIHYRDLAAVVSNAPPEILDSTRDNVMAHERVNETVMRDFTVIPMSFGTVFKTKDDIVELLRSASDAFGDVLRKMQDKLEFGLKVLWDRDQAIRRIEEEDENISRLKQELSTQRGPTYFARMQYGRLVDAALQTRSERYVTRILEELRDVSVASRMNKPIGDKMIMNAAFLISRDREGAFDSRIKAVAAKLDHLMFKYTGPWPPYNFVNIRLKLERV